MKSISPAQHQRLIKKTAELQQIFNYNQQPHTHSLEQMGAELQQLYAQHEALLEALAQNIATYNNQYNNLRKACRSAITIADK